MKEVIMNTTTNVLVASSVEQAISVCHITDVQAQRILDEREADFSALPHYQDDLIRDIADFNYSLLACETLQEVVTLLNKYSYLDLSDSEYTLTTVYALRDRTMRGHVYR